MTVAAFLDRDGVINVDHGYVSRWEDFEFLPGVPEALRSLGRRGISLSLFPINLASAEASTVKRILKN